MPGRHPSPKRRPPRMKRLIPVLAVIVALAALAVPAFAATKTVKVGPRVDFGPTSVSLKRGRKVRFRGSGGLPHSGRVRGGPGGFNTPARRSGTVTRAFRRAGTYRLLCDVHAPGMRMTVRVRR